MPVPALQLNVSAVNAVGEERLNADMLGLRLEANTPMLVEAHNLCDWTNR